MHSIVLPGRENRFSEPLCTDWHTLIQDLSSDIQQLLKGKPFAFWGHRCVYHIIRCVANQFFLVSLRDHFVCPVPSFSKMKEIGWRKVLLVSEKLLKVSPGLPGLQVATGLIFYIHVLYAGRTEGYTYLRLRGSEVHTLIRKWSLESNGSRCPTLGKKLSSKYCSNDRNSVEVFKVYSCIQSW